MSGGSTADNEAKVVLTADPTTFAKFMVDAARSFRDLEKEGKNSVKGIDNQITTLGKNVEAFTKTVLSKVFSTATDPIQRAFGNALAAAREWRSESTRLMGATGEDWKKIGSQIDETSMRAKRMPQDVRQYADAIRQVTDSWETARAGAEDYSELSRYLGRQSLSEMSPLATVMDSMFGIRGQGKAKDFFESAVRGAERLGQSGRQAVQGFERLSGGLGMQTVAGDRGEKFARSAAAMLPALRKAGLSQDQAEQAVAQASSYFSGDLQGLQRQLRSAGLLGRKERLQDEYGRLKYTLPELVGMVGQLSSKHAKGLGGGQDLNLKLLQQNMPGLLAGVAFHGAELQADVATALGAPKTGPGALTKTNAALANTPELQRQFNEYLLQQGARSSVGESKLHLEDVGAAAGAGIARTPDASDVEYAKNYSFTREAKKGMSLSRRIASERGYLFALSRGLIGGTGSLSQRMGEYSGAAERLADPQEVNDRWRRNVASDSEVLGPDFEKGRARGLMTPSDRSELSKNIATEMASKVLTVRAAVPPMPMSGGGNQ